MYSSHFFSLILLPFRADSMSFNVLSQLLLEDVLPSQLWTSQGIIPRAHLQLFLEGTGTGGRGFSFTCVTVHKLKEEEKYFTQDRFVRVWVTPTPFLPTRLLGSPSRTRREQMQINDADERSPAKLYKMQNVLPPVSGTQTKSERKTRRTGEAFTAHKKHTQKKLEEANGFVLHLARSTSAEASSAQIDFLLFEKKKKNNLIYSHWEPKSFAMSFGWWKSK